MPPDSKTRPIGEKTFSQEDQRLFALVSSDVNPMHMDAIAARRLMTGRQVVHGMHILITAIECWQNENNAYPVSISCSFGNPVSVGDRVIFTQHDREANAVAIEARVNGLLCSQIVITAAQETLQGRSDSDSVENTSSKEIFRFENLANPLDEAAEFHLDREYAVRPNSADFSIQFPQAYRYLGKERVAAISALSYFVGMICPGLHSVFSSLSLGLAGGEENEGLLTFSVRKYDARVGLFDISFQGCIHGNIKAFLRPPPQKQPSLKDLAEHVVPEEFRGTRSLVIGGSRGLGEITAKILAAGGGDVVITYASGLEDARKVMDEINNGGMSKCEMLKLDLTTDSFDSMGIDRNSLDAVYFFATPRIARKKAEIFEPRLFHEFCEMYVEKFYELCVYLEANTAEKKIRVYFPSSVFISERPKGMAEYAMAKSAAEVLIEEINRSFRKLSVSYTRLPRLNTDQTSSILKISTESNLEALLPVVRSLNK
jgi:hypothetical protein